MNTEKKVSDEISGNYGEILTDKLTLENQWGIEIIVGSGNVPSKGSSWAAGYDLRCSDDGVILPQERKMINTGIRIAIPSGYYGRIAPRSGLAFRNGIDVFAGVIDSDYRGELKVILYNSDKNLEYKYQSGDRIAQLIIEKYYNLDFKKCVSFTDSTERGGGGFGSTGVK